VAVKLIYRMFAKLLSWMVLHARSDTANEIEILVLRHQLAVLQRRTPRPRISWTNRRDRPTASRPSPPRILVTPTTILRHFIRIQIVKSPARECDRGSLRRHRPP